MIEMKQGNIFTTTCDTIVNTINCTGVMGAGIAYEFRLRYPTMFEKYKAFCEKKQLTIGKLWVYNLSEHDKNKENYTKVLNFPTKNFWKLPSKMEYIEKGLQNFIESYQERNITSIAFPLLGASKGGLSEIDVIVMMRKYLDPLPIKIEIWHYDPMATDDVFEDFKSVFLSLSDDEIKKQSKISLQYLKKIRETLQKDKKIKNMTGLLSVNGIGDVTLEKSFQFIKNVKTHETIQTELF